MLFVVLFSLVAAQSSQPLLVFAASSLQDAFTDIAATFKKQTGQEVQFQFAASGLLAAQVGQGAPADVIAVADISNLAALTEKQLLAPPSIFANNSLIAIAPRNNLRVKSLHDLAAPGVRLVLAAPQVPAGKYALALLQNLDTEFGAGFLAKAKQNIVSEESNVRLVVAKISLGEADAGIVYKTDFTAKMRQTLRGILVPKHLNVVAHYPIATIKHDGAHVAAAAFVQFVRSEAGQRILTKWGFVSP